MGVTSSQAGGLVLPDLRSYYFVSQLTFLHLRFFPQIPNATIVLEAVVTMSLKALLNMLYRGEVPGREVGSVMALPGKVFNICSQNVGDTPLSMSLNNPLWFSRKKN